MPSNLMPMRGEATGSLTGIGTPKEVHEGRGFPAGYGRPSNAFRPFDRSILETSVPARFTAIAREFADRPAVVTVDAVTTYAELDAWSDGIARAVLDFIPAGRVNVAIFLDNGPLVVATALGVLKAACAYVPLDARQTDGISRSIVSACRASAVLTDSGHHQRAAALLEAQL